MNNLDRNNEHLENHPKLYGKVYPPEPDSPRTDAPEQTNPRVELGEFYGNTLTFLRVRKLPSFRQANPEKTVYAPGTQVKGDAVMLAEGYRWLRLTEPEKYQGYFILLEAWDKKNIYIQIEDRQQVPQTLYRIKKDNPPRMLAPGWKSKKMYWSAPAVHPMYISKNPTHSTKRTRLTPWEKYLRALNNNKNKWEYYVSDHSGLFNATGWDKQESLVMGNNLVVVDRIEEFKRDLLMAKLRTLFIVDPQPDASQFNYETCPWLIHKFTIITRNGLVVDPQPGAIYYPVIVNRGGEGWIQLDKLEEFPKLPMTVTVEASSGVNVREGPDEKSNRLIAIAMGMTLEITEYRPVGSQVWGRCEQGWIALYHPSTTPKYLTSWKMETEPPPP